MEWFQNAGRGGVWARLVLVCLVLGSLGGCGTLPDASPLVESAWLLHSALDAAGHAVESELSLYDPERADHFGASWKSHTDASLALAEYAGSIQSVVEASASSRDRVAAVAESVAGLAEAAGFALPQAGGVAVVTDGAAFVYEQVIRIRAASTLEEAMGPAQLAVGFICNQIASDLRKADDIVRLIHGDAQSGIERGWEFEREYRQVIEQERQEVFKLGIGALEPEHQHRLRELNAMLAATDPRDALYQHENQALRERSRQIRQLIGASASAVQAWPVAHAQLHTAVASGREVNIDALLLAIGEVRGLVQRMREL